MRVFPTFIAWWNENKSCMRVDKREFAWEFSQLSLLHQTRTRVVWELTSESLRESFLNFHCLIKREQELHESWQARVYMRVFSTFIAWSNENKSCIRVDKWEFTWAFSQLSLLDQTRTRVAWELTSESLRESFLNFHCLIKREQELHESWQARAYVRFFSTFIAWSNENKSCIRVDKREFTWAFSQLSLLDQTRARVAWELTSESLRESFLNFHCLIKREQESHESWQARAYVRVFSTFIAWSNENKSCMRVDKRGFTWEFSQISLLDQTKTSRVAWRECMRVDERWRSNARDNWKSRQYKELTTVTSLQYIRSLLCLKFTGSCSCSKTFSSWRNFFSLPCGFSADGADLLPYKKQMQF
jgi:predicted transcriptional regulator